ncbi:MAG TPA: hypothetical protein VE544_11355, partial [Nitrososphaeraceae archaeon]|nr:hypothetical protein [Nitrososphaeraceae archaeon]
RAGGAGLRDRADKEQGSQPRDFRALGQLLFRTPDLRNRLACCHRTFAQHDQYWFEHPFRYAL